MYIYGNGPKMEKKIYFQRKIRIISCVIKSIRKAKNYIYETETKLLIFQN